MGSLEVLSFPITELEEPTQVPLGTSALVPCSAPGFSDCPEADSRPQTHGRDAGTATFHQLRLLPQERPSQNQRTEELGRTGTASNLEMTSSEK